MKKIEKSKGMTKSEEYLARLCEKSFLSLWSYPNLCTDKKPSHDELCDLLVVFKNDIIIFSDKSCEFPNTGNLSKDWRRWYKRSILESSKQIYGAERWIKNYPNRIFVDQKTLQPFPIPRMENCRFHRIVIALNASERCSAFFNGDRGSLMVCPYTIGNSHFDEKDPSYLPFGVGQINPSKGFVHVFDDITLDILLRELDTISDFISYLNKKEKFILSGQLISAAGEEELLAYYMTHLNNNEHDFVFPKNEAVLIDKGLWDEYSKDHQYIVKKKADKISYYWDSLIERFNKNIISGSLLTMGEDFDIGNHEYTISDHERSVRILASENRTSRRGLMESIIELIKKTPANSDMVRVLFSPQNKNRAYIFLFSSYKKDEDFDTYRKTRHHALYCYYYVLKLKFPELKEIAGIAFQPPTDEFGGEDILSMDLEEWTDEDDRIAQEIQQERGILLSPKDSYKRYHVSEYPDINNFQSTHSSNRKKRKKIEKETGRNSRKKG